MQLGPQESEVVVVTGVGGTDDKTNTHKHASHTKGGTVDKAVSTSSSSLTAQHSRATYIHPALFTLLFERVCSVTAAT